MIIKRQSYDIQVMPHDTIFIHTAVQLTHFVIFPGATAMK